MGPVVSLFKCGCNFTWDFNQDLRYILCPKRSAKSQRKRRDELRRKMEGLKSAVAEKTRETPGVTMDHAVEIWIDSVSKLSEDAPTASGDSPPLRRVLCCCRNRYKLGVMNAEDLEEIKRLEESYKDVGRNLTMEVSLFENIKDALEKEMKALAATMQYMESKISSDMVRSQELEVWMEGFSSLDKEVSEAESQNCEIGDDKNLQRMRRKIEKLSKQAKELIDNKRLVVTAPVQQSLQEQLQDQMEQLALAKIDLESRVSGLERKEVDPPKLRSERVKKWMEHVDSLEEEVKRLLELSETSSAQNESSDHGQLQAKISKKLGEVGDLQNRVEELERKGLVVEAWPEQFHELPGQAEGTVVGIDGKVEEMLGLLRNDDVELIGIYGMGGVGKTTLVKEVTKKLHSSEGGNFELVTSVVVSQEYEIKGIQEEILVQLGYDRGGLPSFMNEDDRAAFIWEKLRQKSFLMILDDVWEYLDLGKVGYRHSSKKMEAEKRCKVMITSRSQNTCARMGYGHSSRILKVDCLEKHDAWRLFAREIGRDISNSYIPLAEKIVDSCGGLPLLLKTVARSNAKNRTYSDWVTAESQLDKHPTTIRGMDDVHQKLKFSFDRLEEEEHKYCLLYCALFPEDRDIPIEELLPYLIAELCMENDRLHDFDVLRNMATEIIWSLREASLLEEGKSGDHVKLHDAVRDMVIWLGTKERGADAADVRYKMLTLAGKGLDRSRIHADERWVGVKMASLMQNGFQQLGVVQSDETTVGCVQTLRFNRLNGQRSEDSPPPENPFLFSASLRVFDMSDTTVREMPTTVGSLKSLRYLNLSRSEIRKLPGEVGDLTDLRCLDLSYTEKLGFIPERAISPLRQLRSLNLYESFYLSSRAGGGGGGGGGGPDGLKLGHLDCLPRLIDLGLTVRDVVDAKRLQSMKLSRSTSRLCLRKIPDGASLDTICSISSSLQRLELLRIFECKFLSQEWVLDGNRFKRLKVLELVRNEELKNITLINPLLCLQELKIEGCGFDDLGGLLQKLPELRRLVVGECSNLRKLRLNEQSGMMLEFVGLRGLPVLESISSSSIPLPRLTEMHVGSCGKLRKLPIRSCNSVCTRILCEQRWWRRLEWPDSDCNPSRFTPLHLESD